MKNIEVLIIEDNQKVAKAHQLYVEKIPGFIVTGVVSQLADAPQIVEVLTPDLILLDVYFPDGSGMDFLDQLRSMHSKSDVILITAAKEVKLLHNALRGGVFDYMIKPVFFERFQEALENYRQHREQLQQLTEMNQEEVDRFFQHATKIGTDGKETVLPKGIDALTLNKVVDIFEETDDKELSATEVGAVIGASRTTARKYLEYLISTGHLKIEVEYGTIGRPERRYVKAR
ncbi:MAG: response regulator [Desulfuromonadales bacterium]